MPDTNSDGGLMGCRGYVRCLSVPADVTPCLVHVFIVAHYGLARRAIIM